MIDRLELKNFTAFNDLSLEFSSKINVIIGENGTGKTQLLKSIYALCCPEAYVSETEKPGEKLARKLCRLYQPLSDQLGELRRTGVRGNAMLSAEFPQGQGITAQFNGLATTAKIRVETDTAIAPAVFIPTKEVLSLVRGLTSEKSNQSTIEHIFDDGYLDLAYQLIKQGTEDLDSKVQLDPRFASIVPQLANIIGGQYLFEKDRFIFQAGVYKEGASSARTQSKYARIYQDSTEWKFQPSSNSFFSSSMTAEGFRKIGMLQRLLTNGNLSPGVSGPLLWDEPESNLNPKLMELLVRVLMELPRNGQQIILATHDYVLLKWFDLLMDKGKDDHVRFHVLYRDLQSGQVKVDSTDDYREIEKNPIAEAFNQLTIAHAKSSLREGSIE